MGAGQELSILMWEQKSNPFTLLVILWPFNLDYLDDLLCVTFLALCFCSEVRLCFIIRGTHVCLESNVKPTSNILLTYTQRWILSRNQKCAVIYHLHYLIIWSGVFRLHSEGCVCVLIICSYSYRLMSPLYLINILSWVKFMLRAHADQSCVRSTLCELNKSTGGFLLRACQHDFVLRWSASFTADTVHGLFFISLNSKYKVSKGFKGRMWIVYTWGLKLILSGGCWR